MLIRRRLIRLLVKTHTYDAALRVQRRLRKVFAEATDRFSATSKRVDTSDQADLLRVRAVRSDPVPPMAPFPDARYIFMVDAIPPVYGGRTGSILTKARLFKELAGVESEIVMVSQKADSGKLGAALRARGALAEGVAFRDLAHYAEGNVGRSDGSHASQFGSGIKRLHGQIDRLVGDDKVFITSEARNIDHVLLTYGGENVKQIYLLHNAHLKPPYRNPMRLEPAYKPLLEHHAEVDATVFLTNRQRADAELKYGEQRNFFVIPHPAPPVVLSPAIERDPKLVVMLARLDYSKRLDHAIKAFARVLGHVPDARLEIYGTGPEEAQYRRLIRKIGVGRSVTLLGHTTSPGEALQRAALSLLTSRLEGLGLVLLESLSSGCPVVAYDIRYGPSDVISNGVNGVLVDPGNIDALAAGVIRLLKDPLLQRRMSSAALARAHMFSSEAFVARWSALFNALDAHG